MCCNSAACIVPVMAGVINMVSSGGADSAHSTLMLSCSSHPNSSRIDQSRQQAAHLTQCLVVCSFRQPRQEPGFSESATQFGTLCISLRV